MAQGKKKGSTIVDRIRNIVSTNVEGGNNNGLADNQWNNESSLHQELRNDNEPILSLISQHTGIQENEGVSKKKKGRGPANLPDEWNSGKKLDVTLNTEGQIVGAQYHILASSLGCLARVGSSFPITCASWRDVSEKSKQDVWNEVEENTSLPEEAKPLIYERLNILWKEWKHRVKNHYKEYKDDEDAMFKNLDDRVDPDQFRDALRYWKKPEVEKVANVNAANRGQTKFPHRTGRTPFSEIVEQLHLHGAPATQLDVWLVSRGVAKGVIEDVETAVLHEYLLGSLSVVSPEERTAEFKGSLYQNVVRKDKRGRVTCTGKSIHKKLRSSSSSAINQATQEREEFREQLSKLKEEREELNRFKEDLKQEREKEKEELKREREKEKEQWDVKLKQVDEFLELYVPHQSSSRFASCSVNNISQEHDASSNGMNDHHGFVATPTSGFFLDGVNVDLFCFGIPKVIVAEGKLISTNPEDKVDGVPIGSNYFKVLVEKARHPGYKMCRPLKNAFTVGQAVKRIVAWPKANVMEHY